MPRSVQPSPLAADMNVTPMLDVLLVLLVIFMSSVTVMRSMDVRLPEPCTGECRGDGTPIVLDVLPGSVYRLNHIPVPARQLEGRLREVYAARNDKVLLVAGARMARYQDVLGAMDVARSAGVRVIGVPSSDLVPTR